MPRNRLTGIAIICLMLAGCSTAPEIKGTSGFLSQYKNLQPLPSKENEQFIGHVVSESELKQYDKLIIKPVSLQIPAETRKNWQINSERYELLQSYFTQKLHDRMGQHYQMTSIPGERTLELRVAITGGETDMKPLKPYQVLPWALVINGVGEITGVRDKMLNIYEEGELVDSVSGKQLVALVGGVQTGPVDIGDLKERSAEEFMPLIDGWVNAFCQHLPNCQ